MVWVKLMFVVHFGPFLPKGPAEKCVCKELCLKKAGLKLMSNRHNIEILNVKNDHNKIMIAAL